jgi:ribosomal-protein-alanine N-acetyltransferase
MSLYSQMNNSKLRASHGLTLVAATLVHVRTELESPEKLGARLNATVPVGWPPGEYDRNALEFFRARFEENGQASIGWYSWYAVLEPSTETQRRLVGAGGYFGPPDWNHDVQIGYSVLPEWRRRGFATAMVEALVAHAFTFNSVKRVIAQTTAANVGSVLVLRRCGFATQRSADQAEQLRFERTRGTR